MVTAAASLMSLGPSQCQSCHAEGISCSTSYGVSSSLVKSSFEVQRTSDRLDTSFRCKNNFLGAAQFHWLPVRRKLCSSKVSVAADYSDSAPESSNHVWNNGYHPLEELNDRKSVRETKLTYAEIAKTTLEANSSALLIFPGRVHREPHEHISWAEYQYVIDEYGDIFFKIPDDENILQDPGASNPVNAMIEMDIPLIEKRRLAVAEHSLSESGSSDSFPFNENYFEQVEGSDMFEWGMLDTTSSVHPIYFAKCMTKATNMQYAVKMDHPSNGVSILGCLRPAFADEEFYLQRFFNYGESDDYHLDWNDEELSIGLDGDENCSGSTIYRLEIMRVELFSVYGVQSAISLQDFRDADPDILVHSTPDIIERFCEKRARSSLALRALCKKNGLSVEDASLIGVDSLGMDVRVFTGLEVQTHRFPFKVRVSRILKKAAQGHRVLTVVVFGNGLVHATTLTSREATSVACSSQRSSHITSLLLLKCFRFFRENENNLQIYIDFKGQEFHEAQGNHPFHIGLSILDVVTTYFMSARESGFRRF